MTSMTFCVELLIVIKVIVYGWLCIFNPTSTTTTTTVAATTTTVAPTTTTTTDSNGTLAVADLCQEGVFNAATKQCQYTFWKAADWAYPGSTKACQDGYKLTQSKDKINYCAPVVEQSACLLANCAECVDGASCSTCVSGFSNLNGECSFKHPFYDSSRKIATQYNFVENFDSEEWTESDASDRTPVFKKDQSLFVHNFNSRTVLSRRLNSKFPQHSDRLVLEFALSNHVAPNHAGGYLKVLPKESVSKDFHANSPYSIMFGPDHVGDKHFVWVILNDGLQQHQFKFFAPFDGSYRASAGQEHLYTLVLDLKADTVSAFCDKVPLEGYNLFSSDLEVGKELTGKTVANDKHGLAVHQPNLRQFVRSIHGLGVDLYGFESQLEFKNIQLTN
jgi:hypothetical protein